VDELDDPALRVRRLGAPPPSRTLAERILSACDLHDFAVDLVRARARLDHPDASLTEIEAEVHAWLTTDGNDDGVGKPIPWPRR
jgi:hypothetical protein